MTLGDRNLDCAWALVDELVREGVVHACLSPGSRSTPLALALDRHPATAVHVHLDERSAGFVALGIAKATGRPVVVACTSGTAAAELFPAVVEASQSRTPLVVLTADRPPRLRGTASNQTIDQVELFGRYARGYLEPPVPTEAGDEVEAWRAAGSAAFGAAWDGVEPRSQRVGAPGPAHVDCPFEEPLVPSVGWTPSGPASAAGRPTRAYAAVARSYPAFTDAVAGVDRGLVLVGERPAADPSILALAEHLGWPVAAEPTSQLRREGTLAAGQALLASDVWSSAMAPDAVVRFGGLPTSRAALRASESAPSRIVVAPEHALDPDPEGTATLRLVEGRPGIAAELLEGVPPARGASPWREAWSRADRAARAALDEALDGSEEPFEPRIARDVATAVPDGGTLVVGSSMPIRELDLAMAPREGLRVLANRGASGIDGLVSTAVGVASSGTGPTVALLGDLTVLHDAGALLWNARRGTDLTIVVPNDGGGTIFSFLPQRELPEFERLFETPHGLDLGALARAAGAGHELVERGSEVGPAVARAIASGGVRVIEVTVDAEANRRHHDELHAAVDAAVRPLV